MAEKAVHRSRRYHFFFLILSVALLAAGVSMVVIDAVNTYDEGVLLDASLWDRFRVVLNVAGLVLWSWIASRHFDALFPGKA